MAFQGFARQEDLSTNQIKIDIDAVINNDLAEANRMSKFMATNASMDQEHSTLYLNALTDKHEKEQDNLRRNFTFFMNNRAKIQEQIAYNNKIKLQDAERSHPYIPSLGDMLGPALMKMAVDVGSAGIKKAFADHAQAKSEAAAEEHANNVNDYKATYLASNLEQQKNIPTLIENWFGWTTEQQNAAIAAHNAMGQPGQGQIEADRIANWTKLRPTLRENIRFSQDKVAIDYQNYSRSVEIDINGRPWTQAEINQAAPNQETVREFTRLKQQGFLKEIGFSNLNGTSALQVMEAVTQIDAAHSHTAYNSQVRGAKANMREQVAAFAQQRLNQTNGDAVGLYKWAFNPDDSTSPASWMPMSEVHKLFRGWAENGLLSPGQIRKIWEMPNFGGGKLSLMQQHSLNDGHGTRASRAWKSIMDNIAVEDAKAFQNRQIKVDNIGRSIIDRALNGEMDEANARHTSSYLKSHEGQNILFQMSPSVAKNTIAALNRAAGVIATDETTSPGWKYADRNYTSKDLTDISARHIKTTEGKPLSLINSNFKQEMMGLTNSRIRHATKMWIAEVTDHLITTQKIHPESPILREKVLAIANDPTHEFTRQLIWELTAELKPLGAGDNEMYPIPRFPNLAKADGEGTTSFLHEYDAQKAKLKGNISPEDINYNYPSYIKWARNVNAAKKLGSKHLQNVLSNPPKDVQAVITDQGWSPWVAYMNGLEHGGEPYANFKPLDGDDGLDMIEIDQLNDRWGDLYRTLKNPVLKEHIHTHGVTPNAATNRIYEINSLAKSRAMGDSSTGPHLDIKKVGGGNFSLKDLDNYIVVHDSEFGDSPLSKLPVTDTYEGHVRRGSHGIDIGIYAGDKISLKNGAKVVSVKPSRHGDVVKIELPNGEQFEWRHGTFSQGQPQQRPITSQQVIPVPSDIGLTPWTPEDNTSAHNPTPQNTFDILEPQASLSNTSEPHPLYDTVEFLANFNKGNK